MEKKEKQSIWKWFKDILVGTDEEQDGFGDDEFDWKSILKNALMGILGFFLQFSLFLPVYFGISLGLL